MRLLSPVGAPPSTEDAAVPVSTPMAMAPHEVAYASELRRFQEENKELKEAITRPGEPGEAAVTAAENRAKLTLAEEECVALKAMLEVEKESMRDLETYPNPNPNPN